VADFSEIGVWTEAEPKTGSMHVLADRSDRVSSADVRLSRPPGTKPKGVGIHINLHTFKANGRQSLQQSIWIDQNECIEQVDQAGQTALQAVRPREYTARSENSGDFCEQFVLQFDRSDMMQHRKADCAIEARIWKGHSGGVFVSDRDIAVELVEKPIGQLTV
jgi:hypothetical protein